MLKNNLYDVVEWGQNSQVNLSINNEQFIFILLIANFYNSSTDGAILETDLIDLFKILDRSFQNNISTLRERAYDAISELVQQKILSKFYHTTDEEFLVYRLTSFGNLLARYYLAQQELSSLKLSVHLNLIDREVTELARLTRIGGTEIFWQESIYAPLKYIISDVFDNIDLFQRNIDAKQSSVKDEIASLLRTKWAEANEDCLHILNYTTEYFTKLYENIASIIENIAANLLVIQRITNSTDSLHFITTLVEKLHLRLEKIINWNETSINLWSKYDIYVRNFLKTILTLHTDSKFLDRLEESITQYIQYPWYLSIISSQRMNVLRDEALENQPEIPSLQEDLLLDQKEDTLDVVGIPQEILTQIDNYLADHTKTDLISFIQDELKRYPLNLHLAITNVIINRILPTVQSSDEFLLSSWNQLNSAGGSIFGKTRY